jgi:Arc/MetJ-type ribon-helix-helix transcriptional regulator
MPRADIGSARKPAEKRRLEAGRRRGSEFEKVGLTMPKQVAAEARERVREGEANSFSAYVSQAVKEKLERDDLKKLLEEMDAEYGPVSAERMAWADGVIDQLLARD